MRILYTPYAISLRERLTLAHMCPPNFSSLFGHFTSGCVKPALAACTGMRQDDSTAHGLVSTVACQRYLHILAPCHAETALFSSLGRVVLRLFKSCSIRFGRPQVQISSFEHTLRRDLLRVFEGETNIRHCIHIHIYIYICISCRSTTETPRCQYQSGDSG